MSLYQKLFCLNGFQAAGLIVCTALITICPGPAAAQAVGGFFRPPAASSPPATASSQPPPSNSTPVRQFSSPGRVYAPAGSEPVFVGNGYGGSVRQREPSSPGIRYREPINEPEPAPVQTYSNEGPTVVHSRGGLYSTVVQGRVNQPAASERISRPQGTDREFYRNTEPQGTGRERPSIRIITPQGPTPVPVSIYGGGYFYAPSPPVRVALHGPPLLGGYYYGNYCDAPDDSCTYRSVYSDYDDFPRYIYSPAVIVVSEPYCPRYVTAYLPFCPPIYAVTYNENTYYVNSEDRVHEFDEGGDEAQRALENAYPADSYQAAFADIEKAWADDRLAPIQKHLRDPDSKISVFLDGSYSYSIASGDYEQITRDALDHLNTFSFQFTTIRKAKSGDVTAYGKHVYQGRDPADGASDDSAGDEKTVYVSYTLRHRNGAWYIIAIDSSKNDLAPEDH